MRCIRIALTAVIVLSIHACLYAIDGSGTEPDPWTIESRADFNDFASDSNYWSGHVRLDCDVNLADTIYTNAVIGADINIADINYNGGYFTGVFDGNGHKIINLTIDSGTAGTDYIGLFSVIGASGTIKNLIIEDCNIKGSASWAGSLAFVTVDGSSILNCSATGTVIAVRWVGGLVGLNGGLISGCSFTGQVTGVDCVGGLIGAGAIDDCNIVNCYASGTVTADSNAGGFAGSISPGGIISNSFFSGTVTGISDIGGFAGSNAGKISSCYCTAIVYGVDEVGGLTGGNSYSQNISNCYSFGKVNGRNYVGGLVGCNKYQLFIYNNVSNCYSAVDVNGTGTCVGGLIGRNTHCDVLNCFWDSELQSYGVTESIGLIDSGVIDNVEGMTTAQMQTAETFLGSGWDMVNTWGIGQGQTYPYLRKYSAADLNSDGQIDFADLAVFAGNWLSGT